MVRLTFYSNTAVYMGEISMVNLITARVFALGRQNASLLRGLRPPFLNLKKSENYHNGVRVLSSWSRLTDNLTRKRKREKKKKKKKKKKKIENHGGGQMPPLPPTPVAPRLYSYNCNENVLPPCSNNFHA